MFVSIYYKPRLFNAHTMILIVHIFMNVNKLCLNQRKNNKTCVPTNTGNWSNARNCLKLTPETGNINNYMETSSCKYSICPPPPQLSNSMYCFTHMHTPTHKITGFFPLSFKLTAVQVGITAAGLQALGALGAVGAAALQTVDSAQYGPQCAVVQRSGQAIAACIGLDTAISKSQVFTRYIQITQVHLHTGIWRKANGKCTHIQNE